MFLHLIATTAVLVTSVAALDASAVGGPDSAAIERLSRDLRSHSRVRVLSMGEEFLLDGVEPRAEGLRYDRMTTREGAIYRSKATRRAETLPWTRIEKLEVRTPRVGGWVALGAATGLALGLAVSANQECQTSFLGFGESNCFTRQVLPVLGGVAVGAGAGAVIGYQRAPWRTLHP